ncbi:unnamed protein product [Rotaria sp. Silwood1]|nr:unnamed protein product [Rotaria sp. Silwood1]
MATLKSLSHHRNYQIAPSVISSKFRSKSSDSFSNTNNNKKIESEQKEKQINKIIKMKKSQIELTNLEIKPIETICNTTSMLRRRFSLFRIKRSQPTNENVNIQALQQIIEKLRHDLQIKTDELETMKKYTENKRNSIIQPSNESIEQAFQLQTILNTRLEEMLTENDLLKKSVQELESFAQQQKIEKFRKRMLSYYYHQQYEEQKLHCQMESIYKQNSFYNDNKKEYSISSSSVLTSTTTTTKNKLISRKISNSNDDSSSFSHAMYIIVKKRRTTSPSHQSFEDSQCLQLPDICSTILATSNSPTTNSLLTTTFTEPNNSIIKSTNFTSSIPTSRAEIRHKSEIEIEVKHEKQQQLNNAIKNSVLPTSTASYSSVIRPTNITNKQTSIINSDENSYQIPKRRILTNSVQTQTLPLLLNQSDHKIQQQKLKALTDETLSKNEKIQALLRELTDYQVTIKQQEQQLANGKKDRDQLCFIVDERTSELRNLKQKNEQLEQMIRNEQEHSNDEKKLISLLQESQEERDELLSQKRQTYERIQKLEEQIKIYESDATKMRDQILCSKIKLDKKIDENQCLTNKLTDMSKFCDRLEQENQKLKLQIEHEQKKMEECTKLKTFVDIELQNTLDKIRNERYEHETKVTTLDDALKYAQKQNQILQQNQHIIEDKHKKEIYELKQHIHELEIKIEEVIKDKALVSIRCGELIEENRKLEKTLNEKEDDYKEKINSYKEKNSHLSIQIEDLGKKLIDTKKQLELITIEKDETLSDMLIAVRVASEMRHDAEDRLNKVNDDLRRVTEHIEQERALNKEVQRRQMQLPPKNRNGNGFCKIGHVKIKEMIRTLEANSRKNSIHTVNNHIDSTVRQRPLSQPCTRTETNAILTNNHHRQFGTTTDDAKILSSTKNNSPSFNNTHRSDVSIRSITNEQYDEMKSIVEAVCARMPGSVCKRDALLKWCVEKLANYEILITNFSNSWTDGIAFCSLLHSYLPDRIDLDMIKKESKKKRFEIAFNIASSIGIVSILDVDEMCSSEWPDWERVMYYVALIFRHFECSTSNQTISPILPIPQASSSPMSPTFSTSSSPICSALRSSNSIPTILCSPLQTV